VNFFTKLTRQTGRNVNHKLISVTFYDVFITYSLAAQKLKCNPLESQNGACVCMCVCMCVWSSWPSTALFSIKTVTTKL
jgi:hypothetical protein